MHLHQNGDGINEQLVIDGVEDNICYPSWYFLLRYIIVGVYWFLKPLNIITQQCILMVIQEEEQL